MRHERLTACELVPVDGATTNGDMLPHPSYWIKPWGPHGLSRADADKLVALGPDTCEYFEDVLHWLELGAWEKWIEEAISKEKA